jgi:acetyl-CoA synthetase
LKEGRKMFADKFLKKSKFDSYEDYIENGAPVAPENFNFAYDVVDAIAHETPEKLALVWTNDLGEKLEISFRELSEKSNAAANVLTDLGVKKGDAVLLFLRRRFEYWVLMMALHKIGAVPVPSTNQLKSSDIKYRVEMAEVKTIIAFDDGQIFQEIESASTGAEVFSTKEISLKLESASKEFARVSNNNDDLFMIYFTSGTTDNPKMVAHDFTYPLGHISTAVFWQGLDESDLHFTLSETGWAKCSWGKMYGQWLAGAAVFVYDFSGKFSACDLLRVIAENKITSFCAAPTVYKMLIHEDWSAFDLSSMKKAQVAGEALNPEVFRKFLALTGIKMREGFGQTETTVQLFTNQWIEPRPGSMGMPAAGYEVVLLSDRGKPVSDMELGEITLSLENGRPAGLFKEYYKNEKKTKAAFAGGYYHTGDVAYRDADGYYWFVGRNDDLIKSSGYRISPFEVESILLEHPAVRECAVTGIPDEVRGMAVKATIVLNRYFHGTDVLVSEIQTFVKTKTASYKYPRVIEFVESLPMTISGKIKRVVIRTADATKELASDLKDFTKDLLKKK